MILQLIIGASLIAQTTAALWGWFRARRMVGGWLRPSLPHWATLFLDHGWLLAGVPVAEGLTLWAAGFFGGSC